MVFVNDDVLAAMYYVYTLCASSVTFIKYLASTPTFYLLYTFIVSSKVLHVRKDCTIHINDMQFSFYIQR